MKKRSICGNGKGSLSIFMRVACPGLNVRDAEAHFRQHRRHGRYCQSFQPEAWRPGCRTLRVVLLAGLACLMTLPEIPTSAADRHEDKLESGNLHYSVSWLGNSFSGASNKWVQNFFIHTKVQPDGTVNTWSHWDEGGKKFGVYKDGDVIGNTNISPNSLETKDSRAYMEDRLSITSSRSSTNTTSSQKASRATANRSGSPSCSNRWRSPWPTTAS